MIELTWIIGLVLLGTFVAGIVDFKTGFIYDWITYPLIAIGLLNQIWGQTWLNLAVALGVLVIGGLFYYTGKVGGGDVKLFLGMALLLPFYQGTVFVVMSLLYATLVAVGVLSIYYGAKYLAVEKKPFEKNRKRLGLTIVYALGLLLYAVLAMTSNLFSVVTLAAIMIPLTLGLVFFFLEEGIRKQFFLVRVAPSKLEEDEIIAWDELEEKEKKQLELGSKRVLEENDVKRLLELGLKTIPVYRNLPRFGIFIFLGVVLALMFPHAVFPTMGIIG